jgi:cation diffusion facilitator family transporter
LERIINFAAVILIKINAKVKVARLEVLSNSLLIVMKVAAGIQSGSVSIISEAIHSGMDLVAAVIAFFSVKMSDNPSDKEHPYGHGKFENVSGVIEAFLIFIAAFRIILEAVKKILNPGQIEAIGWGSAVMFISAAVNFFVSRRLYSVAKKTESVDLEADALHLKTDVYTSLGVGLDYSLSG